MSTIPTVRIISPDLSRVFFTPHVTDIILDVLVNLCLLTLVRHSGADGVRVADKMMEDHPSPSKLSKHNSEPDVRDTAWKNNTTTIFESINERRVDDISLEYFYQPHTLSALVLSIAFVIYLAFTRNNDSLEENIWVGLLVAVFFFLLLSSLAFPNGPFTRPHPVIWRIVFGVSVLYLLLLLLLLFQNYQTVKSIMYWFYPDLKDFHIDSEKEYGVNCSDITWDRVKSHIDVFAWAHLTGWTMKALLIRHYGICWTISVTWEITEYYFAHLLPNFAECWWDALILDVVVCNGLGIWLGMKICEWFEMRTYKWESIKNIPTARGKIRRAVLQFTPASWTNFTWMDPNCTYKRIFAVTELVVLWQVTELNTFFLKHIFEAPPAHPLNIARICLVGVIVAPSLRQFYCYVTDTQCKRLGTQCWVFCAIMMTEALICVKFGLKLFKQTQIVNIVTWIVIQVRERIVSMSIIPNFFPLQFVMSIACVWLCARWAKRCFDKKHQISDKDEMDSLKTSSPSHARTRSLIEMVRGVNSSLSSQALKKRPKQQNGCST